MPLWYGCGFQFLDHSAKHRHRRISLNALYTIEACTVRGVEIIAFGPAQSGGRKVHTSLPFSAPLRRAGMVSRLGIHE